MTNNDKPRNGSATVASGGRQRSRHHPRNTLKQAEELARVVYKEGARRCDLDNIAKKAGFSSANNNSSFATLKASALQFGLIDADSQTISLSEEWINTFLSDDQQQLRRARQMAMRQPDLYKQLIEDFGDSQLPEVDKLAQRLHLNPKYGILKDAAGVAAKVFFESAYYAGLLSDDRRFIQPLDSITVVDIGTADKDDQEDEKGTIPDRETSRDTGTGQTAKGKPSDVRPETPPELAELFKIDIPLENDRVMYIYGPRRILREDKVRIKQYVDLWLEERPSSSKPTDERSSAASAGKPTDERSNPASDQWNVEL